MEGGLQLVIDYKSMIQSALYGNIQKDGCNESIRNIKVKLSGKEKPMTLTGKVPDDKHINEDGSPWWVAAQALPTNPVYIDLKIDYDKIVCDSYEITGIKGADEFKNAVINYDLDKVGETKFHSFEINHSDRNK